MRNVLVHDYFDVDFESVWNVLMRDLAALEAVMHSIQSRLDEDD
jgi:uncharacterized protein with HEPN domain